MGDPGSVKKGNKKSFDVTVKVENPDEYVPFDNVTVSVGGKKVYFDLDGNKLSGSDSGITISSVDYGGWGSWGYGYDYGYGYANNTDPYGYGYNFGYGYGYANNTDPYGYGYNFGYGYGYGYSSVNPNTFTYTVQVDTSNLGLSAGNSYDVQAVVAAGSKTFSSSTKSLKIKKKKKEGGDGGPSAAPSLGDHVEKRYTKYTAITVKPGEPADVEFPEGSPVTSLRINSKRTIFNPSFQAAEHTQKPEDVEEPGGTVHRFLSITSSIQDSDIDSVDIEFQVEQSWLQNNDLAEDEVLLSRWHDGEWQDLDTEVVSSDGTVSYRATSPGFSVYSVRGEKKAEATPTPTPAPEATPTPTPTPKPTPTPRPTVEQPAQQPEKPFNPVLVLGLMLVIALAIGAAVYRSIEEE